MQEAGEPYVHEVSVVVPVYQGEATLKPLVDEIVPLLQITKTPAGNLFRVIEILLVNDNGPDNSAGAIRQLATSQPAVRPVWLSRNFGQHAATLAGIASSGGAWVVTMDEDGQHAPADIGLLIDTAIAANSPLVYGQHEGDAPHTAMAQHDQRDCPPTRSVDVGRRHGELQQLPADPRHASAPWLPTAGRGLSRLGVALGDRFVGELHRQHSSEIAATSRATARSPPLATSGRWCSAVATSVADRHVPGHGVCRTGFRRRGVDHLPSTDHRLQRAGVGVDDRRALW